MKSGNKCDLNCASGYGNNTLDMAVCITCATNCTSCLDSATYCLSCKPGNYLHDDGLGTVSCVS